MISFIVPTLWKSQYVHQSVDNFLINNKFGAEFIIIDNAHSGYTHDGISVINTEKNLYVNPAWNFGVNISKNNVICLLNDDITFNFKTFFNNLQDLLKTNPNFGIIAFDQTNFFEEINKDDDKLQLIEAPGRGLGFGCMMTMMKSQYIPIPETMTVFSGDDYLYYYHHNIRGNKCYIIDNFKAVGELSATSRGLDDLVQVEANIFQEEIQKLNIKNQ